jgi:hypothetical protein
MFRLQKSLLVATLGLASLACVGADPADETPDNLGPGPEADLSNLTVEDLDPDLARAGSTTPTTGELVGADELPANLREILDAWRQGGFVWEIKRGEVLASPDETEFLVNNLMLLLFDEARAMRSATAAAEADPSQRPVLVRLRSELSLCGEPAARALAETLGLGDDMLASMAIDILGQLGNDAAPAVAAMLDREAAVVRYRALGCLARLPGAGGREGEVIAALESVARGDVSEIVRVAAVRTLGERGLFSQAGKPAADVDFAPWSQAVAALLKDPSDAVRVEALGALGTLGDPRAIPAVIAFGESARGVEVTAARKTLESLTGQRLGTDFKAWRAWWAGREEN